MQNILGSTNQTNTTTGLFVTQTALRCVRFDQQGSSYGCGGGGGAAAATHAMM